MEQMYYDIKELLPIQREVNEKVREKLDAPVEFDQFMVAFNVELFEFFNEVGVWKWWKHSHKLNKENILDELADCFAFFLSAVDVQDQLAREDVADEVQTALNELSEIHTNYRNDSDHDSTDMIIDLIKYVGTDNEVEGVLMVERFAIAIFIVRLLFSDITWEEIADAYRKKSEVNIQRQVENY
ncbi:MAG: dUTP diphosphatase [Bacillota bacterium]